MLNATRRSGRNCLEAALCWERRMLAQISRVGNDDGDEDDAD